MSCVAALNEQTGLLPSMRATLTRLAKLGRCPLLLEGPREALGLVDAEDQPRAGRGRRSRSQRRSAGPRRRKAVLLARQVGEIFNWRLPRNRNRLRTSVSRRLDEAGSAYAIRLLPRNCTWGDSAPNDGLLEDIAARAGMRNRSPMCFTLVGLLDACGPTLGSPRLTGSEDSPTAAVGRRSEAISARRRWRTPRRARTRSDAIRRDPTAAPDSDRIAGSRRMTSRAARRLGASGTTRRSLGCTKEPIWVARLSESRDPESRPRARGAEACPW